MPLFALPRPPCEINICKTQPSSFPLKPISWLIVLQTRLFIIQKHKRTVLVPNAGCYIVGCPTNRRWYCLSLFSMGLCLSSKEGVGWEERWSSPSYKKALKEVSLKAYCTGLYRIDLLESPTPIWVFLQTVAIIKQRRIQLVKSIRPLFVASMYARVHSRCVCPFAANLDTILEMVVLYYTS